MSLNLQEHRSTFYLPYWNFPLAKQLVPRLREFHANLDVIDTQLDALITRAVNTKQVDDIEALQVRARCCSPLRRGLSLITLTHTSVARWSIRLRAASYQPGFRARAMLL